VNQETRTSRQVKRIKDKGQRIKKEKGKSKKVKVIAKGS
jgi:hypothetical protein